MYARAASAVKRPLCPVHTLPVSAVHRGWNRIRNGIGSSAASRPQRGCRVVTSESDEVLAKHSLILIDGDDLSRLLVRYGVGVRAIRTIELKKIDLDYFEEQKA